MGTVRELLARISAERRLDFEPTPTAVAAALPELVEAVERIAGRLTEPQERRWLAAALAALSHRCRPTPCGST
ncbi:hypothetical protein [Pseudonocardia nigra]|uniref:hypothetical protein n=1 Tax=Pseudonocardia nigra TaxID=1921578 RepID=UPI001FEC143C|nr:hypothetical protein [Pseudonocardia nigra]